MDPIEHPTCPIAGISSAIGKAYSSVKLELDLKTLGYGHRCNYCNYCNWMSTQTSRWSEALTKALASGDWVLDGQ